MDKDHEKIASHQYRRRVAKRKRLRENAPAMLALLIEHSGDPDTPCHCDDWMTTPAGTKCLNCRTKAVIEAVNGGAH